MCPLYPLHFILLYLSVMLPLLFAVVEGSEEILLKWKFSFMPKAVDKIGEGNSTIVELQCHGCQLTNRFNSFQVALVSDDPNVVGLEHQINSSQNLGSKQNELLFELPLFPLRDDVDNMKFWSVPFKMSGVLVGMTKIRVQLKHPFTSSWIITDTSLSVSVVKQKSIWSKVFGYVVAIVIMLAYINMGCAMDLNVVRETVRKPIGPLIGFFCQYILMPLLSFAIGYVAFESAPMRLGLFVAGCSPGGGASNIWTLMFGGNLNLSLTMTAISTVAAFGMMPLWMMTLGQLLFVEHEIVIPYYKLCTYAFGLVIPLGIGLILQKTSPRLSHILVRLLKFFAIFIILFIVVFGIWVNVWMFELITWKVWLAGMSLPWLGYAFGCTAARMCRLSAEDVIAIAIETGVQNTGVSIFMLWFTFDHPLGDLAAVVPVAVATMTPLPLICSLAYLKFHQWTDKNNKGSPHQPNHLHIGDFDEKESQSMNDEENYVAAKY